MSLSTWSRALVAIAAGVMLILPAAATAAPPPKTGSLEQVGHEPLMDRGMNAAMAIHGDYAYIGSRTDGAPRGHAARRDHGRRHLGSVRPRAADG